MITLFGATWVSVKWEWPHDGDLHNKPSVEGVGAGRISPAT
jgi:hypothetical protein